MTNVRNLSSVGWESGPDRKLAHNTYRVTIDGAPGIMFHRTVIILRVSNGYRLSSGGWQTSTTKQRLNALMPGGYGIHQKDFRWYVTLSYGEVVPFEDGMVIAGNY